MVCDDVVRMDRLEGDPPGRLGRAVGRATGGVRRRRAHGRHRSGRGRGEVVLGVVALPAVWGPAGAVGARPGAEHAWRGSAAVAVAAPAGAVHRLWGHACCCRWAACCGARTRSG